VFDNFLIPVYDMANQMFTKQDERIIWASARSVLELDNVKYKKNGKRSKSHWSTFEKLLKLSTWFLKWSGFMKKGLKNALDIEKKELNFTFDNLPKKFDGFKILHLSDLHIDSLPSLPDAILKAINNEDFDLCVITGDYRFCVQGAYQQIVAPLKKILDKLKTKHGIFAVLGNHDTCRIINYQQELGLTFLINESTEIEIGGEKIRITGTDDPFKYFTQRAVDALEDSFDGFKIALVHTTELADTASQHAYKLYLCGHTHAGQICLPGGIPLITHQYEGRRFYKGVWHRNGMTGYTSAGCGVSGLPIRFYTRGEVTRIILHCKQ
jgi:hypothetical protein